MKFYRASIYQSQYLIMFENRDCFTDLMFFKDILKANQETHISIYHSLHMDIAKSICGYLGFHQKNMIQHTSQCILRFNIKNRLFKAISNK